MLPMGTTVGLTGWLCLQTAQQESNVAAEYLGYSTISHLNDSLNNWLAIPLAINAMNVSAVNLELLNWQDPLELHHYFSHQMDHFPQSQGVFFLSSQGEFTGELRLQGDDRQLLRAGATTQGFIEIYKVGVNHKIEGLIERKSQQDLRQWPWYQQAIAAHDSIWGLIPSPEFYPVVAMPVLTPLYNPEGKLLGVFGNHLFFQDLGKLLQSLPLKNQGQVVIMERSGQAIATSSPEDFLAAPRPLSQLSDPITQRAVQLLLEKPSLVPTPIQRSTRLKFRFQGDSYLFQIHAFGQNQGLDWLVLLIVPEAEFRDGLEHNQFLILGFWGCALFLGWIIGHWVTTGILGSVAEINRVAAAIAQGNWSQRVQPQRFQELNTLSYAFNHMAEQLQSYFLDLQRSNEALKQSNLELGDSESRFRRFAEHSKAVLWIYDPHQDRQIYVSPAYEKVWGYSVEELYENHGHFARTIHPEDLSQFQANLSNLQPHQICEMDYRIIRSDGSVRWIRAHSFRFVDRGDYPAWIGGIAEDITDRKKTEESLTHSEAHFRLLAENSNDLICLQDPQGIFLYVSPSVEQILKFSPQDLLHQDPYGFFHPDDRESVRRQMEQLIQDGIAVPMTYRMRRKTGDYVWLETLSRPMVNDQGQVVQLQSTSRDVTQKIRMQRQLEHDAFHDSLTGLPNRNYLVEQLKIMLRECHRHQSYNFAILFLDLDRFKIVNDSLGHLSGDELLMEISHRLRQIVRPDDLVTRLGGDEFVVVLVGVGQIHEVLPLVEAILQTLRPAFSLSYEDVFITASIGIVMSSPEYQHPTELIRDADIAMYRAKSKGRNCYEVFDPIMHLQARRRLELESNLRKALENQEFVVYYQPIIAIHGPTLKGFEALVRWQHPTQGLISPLEFIPVAEETGLIIPLGIQVLEQVCHQFQAWKQTYPIVGSLTVGVNLSAMQLRDPQFLQQLDDILERYQLSGQQLVFELTESLLIDDIQGTISLLRKFNDRGILVSVDDFGTGYSSLSYLHQLPISTLKIDKSFVNLMLSGSMNRNLVHTIITLAQHLNLKTVAEGVETLEQLQQLKGLGCDYVQGYLFNPPLSPQDANNYLCLASSDFYLPQPSQESQG